MTTQYKQIATITIPAIVLRTLNYAVRDAQLPITGERGIYAIPEYAGRLGLWAVGFTDIVRIQVPADKWKGELPKEGIGIPMELAPDHGVREEMVLHISEHGTRFHISTSGINPAKEGFAQICKLTDWHRDLNKKFEAEEHEYVFGHRKDMVSHLDEYWYAGRTIIGARALHYYLEHFPDNEYIPVDIAAKCNCRGAIFWLNLQASKT